jgi:hypothetical protein
LWANVRGHSWIQTLGLRAVDLEQAQASSSSIRFNWDSIC